jgi:3-oxoacyl-[acyl-carrier protein] reductase
VASSESPRLRRVELGLEGKVCVVTGASRGIGRETARRLCAEGARVLMIARSEQELRRAVEECGRAGARRNGGAAALVCDVTAPDAAELIVAEATERFAPVEVLVNNAGTAKWQELEDVADADWQASWELNVIAPHRLMRAVVPAMRERRWGRIVNVSSTAGKRPSRYMPEYSVAKAAQLALSRLYADRFAADGVLVNAVCPGPTKSELWVAEGGLADQSAALSDLPDRDAAIENAGAARPIGRLAEVGEIAAAIVFLCSEQASYVAGAAWSVDGGTVQVII